MKIKVIKKKKIRSAIQNNSQLELKFIESSKKKNKNISQTQTINSISIHYSSKFIIFFNMYEILL